MTKTNRKTTVEEITILCIYCVKPKPRNSAELHSLTRTAGDIHVVFVERCSCEPVVQTEVYIQRNERCLSRLLVPIAMVTQLRGFRRNGIMIFGIYASFIPLPRQSFQGTLDLKIFITEKFIISFRC